MVEEVARHLKDLGFDGPETHYEGTDFHVSFRRDSVQVSVFSEDMGTNFPQAYVRWSNRDWTEITEGGTYPTYNGEYPAHAELWTTAGWWKRRAARKRLGPVLEEEFSRRARRVLSAAAQIVEEVDRAAGAV